MKRSVILIMEWLPGVLDGVVDRWWWPHRRHNIPTIMLPLSIGFLGVTIVIWSYLLQKCIVCIDLKWKAKDIVEQAWLAFMLLSLWLLRSSNGETIFGWCNRLRHQSFLNHYAIVLLEFWFHTVILACFCVVPWFASKDWLKCVRPSFLFLWNFHRHWYASSCLNNGHVLNPLQEIDWIMLLSLWISCVVRVNPSLVMSTTISHQHSFIASKTPVSTIIQGAAVHCLLLHWREN